ncbi:hypothetical protein C0995_005705 [Termitomyces sp. Mi166|nr:hypothetical protein C0995_005705 [Termitomyces sp. Mi166\
MSQEINSVNRHYQALEERKQDVASLAGMKLSLEDRCDESLQHGATSEVDFDLGKTKAKQRYLKRKKERRKLKNKASGAARTVPETDDGSDGDSDEAADEDPASEDDGQVVLEKAELKNDEKTSKQPKKRRKIIEEMETARETVEIIDAQETAPTELEISTEPPLEAPEPHLPSGTLPSFPLPALPNAPSKSVLALQGLDQALVDAELVDPATLLPIPDGPCDGGTQLSERTRKRLQDLGITELFAVQTRLLPFLLPRDPFQKAIYQPYNPPRDVCVSAPTGSGKTLAYVLPIIEILSTRIVTRLRALIVLPTRDLVMQVRETFETLGRGRGFQHLRFLVIDEADRLLAQSFQDWLAQVLAATRPPPRTDEYLSPGSLTLPTADAVSPAFLHTLPYPDIAVFPTESKASSCQKLLFSATLTRDPGKIAALELRDPKYFIVQESQREGILDVVMEKFSIPTTLAEHMIVCEPSQKPLMFFYLVHSHQVTNALIFTKSAESTSRLVQLFNFFEKARAQSAVAGTIKEIVVRAYSSDLPASERKTILEKFKAREIQILVCSDLISRGIDISHVSHVVSYDVPVDMRKYVHRVGRTARAGRTGDAWTLVEEQEARYFKGILREADHLNKVKRLRVGEKDLTPLLPAYEIALGELKQAYAR